LLEGSPAESLAYPFLLDRSLDGDASHVLIDRAYHQIAKALRAVGQYLREHGALVAAFYTSNVEQYLFRPGQGPRGRGVINGGAGNFYSNVASLPLDANSVFIRSNVPGNNVGSRGDINTNPAMIAPIQATLDAIKTGEIRSYSDLLRIRK
jgi:hypothetical protein